MQYAPFEQATVPEQRIGIKDMNAVFRGSLEGLGDAMDVIESTKPRGPVDAVERVLADPVRTTQEERDNYEYFDEVDDAGKRHVGWRIKYPNITGDPYDQATPEVRAMWERQLRAGEELEPFSYVDNSGHQVVVNSPDRHRVQPIVQAQRLARVAPPSISLQRRESPQITFTSGMKVRPSVAETPLLRSRRLGKSGVMSVLRPAGTHRANS